jgi:hypothetical protein
LPVTEELGILAKDSGSNNLQRSINSAETVRIKGMKRFKET